MYDDLLDGKKKMAVVGLGYVGLPIAVEFAKKVRVIGYDINSERIELCKKGIDTTNEVSPEDMKKTTVQFTNDKASLAEEDFIIIAVPTPVHLDKKPDLRPVTEASLVVGRYLRKGTIVVYESTVYPGVTEEVCAAALERTSGLKCGRDFKVAYSPERINPGDKQNRLNNIVKIVSGMDDETLETVAKVYDLIVEAGVYRAESIKVAEAAKLAENAQRDINIAFMNELAIAFDLMHIDTIKVIEAMNTKWNALHFYPGLVGGHCIGIDPYYFIYQAEQLGYSSQIISAGRRINDSMGEYISDRVIKSLILADKPVKNSRVFIFGVTFKENCGDTRNSKVADIIKRLDEYDIHPMLVDPVANPTEAEKAFGMKPMTLEDVSDADCIVFAVAHTEFKQLDHGLLKQMYREVPGQVPVIIDVKRIFDRGEMEKKGFMYWGL